VWGSGKAAILELDRRYLRKVLIDVGLPSVPATVIKGIKALKAHLKSHNDVWIKNSGFRGDFESAHHIDMATSQAWLDDVAAKLGPYQESFEFLVEKSVRGIETGYDGFTVDGQFPDTCIYGYEEKGEAYICKVANQQSLPKLLREPNEKLAPILKKFQCRSFYSNEMRVADDGTAYLTDPCMRSGLPPSQLYIELFKNWDEIIWNGAAGILTEPVPLGKFGAQIIVGSPWIEKKYMALSIPDNDRRWVKLVSHLRVKNKDYVAPNDAETVCSVIAIGDSVDEVVDKVIDRVGSLESIDLRYNISAFDSLKRVIEKGKKKGVNW
jgi:hypothetical protein